jgi:hypothetical protein
MTNFVTAACPGDGLGYPTAFGGLRTSRRK